MGVACKGDNQAVLGVSNMENFFLARDEIIDCKDDVDDHLMKTVVTAGRDNMAVSVSKRLSNALALLEDLRKELGIPDRNHDSVAPNA